MTSFPVGASRARFPGLTRQHAGAPVVFLDGPAGSQMPQSVVDAIGHYLLHTNANQGGAFATSAASDAVVVAARQATADFLGAGSEREIVFGASMTALAFALAQALRTEWRAGDEIVVTQLDHDANVTPWVEAAAAAGVTVRHVGVDPTDCTLRLDDLSAALSPRTRLVACGAASNLVGTLNPVAEIAARVHEVGAELFVDAVHFAPHRLLDVQGWDCDYLACSAYKFFGPHVGILWGRSERLERLPVHKVRPASDGIPDRWMNGTPNLEGIAGVGASIEYLAALGSQVAGQDLPRRAALQRAFTAIEEHESALCGVLLAGLAGIDGVRVWGISDPARLGERAPTVAFTHPGLRPAEIGAALGERGIFAWTGHSYAVPLTEALGLEPDGVVRLGLLHYNTRDEVERTVAAVTEIVG